MARSTLAYVLQLPAKDASVIEAMKSLSAQYPRYGYRRACAQVNRQRVTQGMPRVNPKRAYRVMAKAGLLLPKAPLFIRSDNAGRSSSARPSWSGIAHAGIATVPNDPGKPRQRTCTAGNWHEQLVKCGAWICERQPLGRLASEIPIHFAKLRGSILSEKRASSSPKVGQAA